MLGWKPKDPKDQVYLQYCRVCGGYKAPRSHHCKTCGRCVLKMDHHCPWINTCVGYLNHSHFLNFVVSAPIGCLYCCTLCAYRIYYVITRSFALFRFGYDHKLLFSFYELIILVIGLGLAFGVVLAVGGLGYCQIRGILRNKTAIEDWIMTKVSKTIIAFNYAISAAQDRRDNDPTLKPMVYPYDLGWKNNLQQIEQLQQKSLKSKTAVLFRIRRPYSGSILPVTFGCRTFCCPPCSGESRIAVAIGDMVSVTRAHKRWYYGQILSPLQSDDVNPPKVPVKGWFPRACVSATNYTSREDKHKQN
ncbi:hypothetical protein ACTXT7_015511 [Hymenolepis weldensis]